MRHLVQGDDSVDCFDSAVWLQDRNLIYFAHNTDAGNAQSVELKAKRGSGSLLTIATYALDSNKKAAIDVTDWLRTYPDTTQFVVKDDKCNDLILISCSVAGLINPSSFIIPDRRGALDYYVIAPPKMMLMDIGCAPILEFRGHHKIDEVEMSPYDLVVQVSEGSVTLRAGTDGFVLYEGLDEGMERYTMKPLLCGVKYAAVEWVSASGATKRHTWMLKSAISSAGDKISLATIDGSYNEIKGREDSFVLFLDNLNAYDAWYYSDICTSSCVKVSLDGTNWRQVSVGTDGVQQADGEAEFQKIEIKVTYKAYDAFAM